MKLVTDPATACMIGMALMLLPDRVRDLALTDFYTEDPVFTGLHEWDEAEDGRSFRTTPHFCTPENGPRIDRPTIVLPCQPMRSWSLHWALRSIVHELGHAVWWELGDRSVDIPRFTPVSEYAETNAAEEFAEGFASVFAPVEARTAYQYDPDVHGYFAALSLR